jgi:hypothetical protein
MRTESSSRNANLASERGIFLQSETASVELAAEVDTLACLNLNAGNELMAFPVRIGWAREPLDVSDKRT